MAEARKQFPNAIPADVSLAVDRLQADESKIRQPAAFIRSRKDQVAAELAGITAARHEQAAEAQRQRARFEQWKTEHSGEITRFKAEHGDCPECMAAATESVMSRQCLVTCQRHQPPPPWAAPCVIRRGTGARELAAYVLAGVDLGQGGITEMSEEARSGGT